MLQDIQQSSKTLGHVNSLDCLILEANQAITFVLMYPTQNGLKTFCIQTSLINTENQFIKQCQHITSSKTLYATQTRTKIFVNSKEINLCKSGGRLQNVEHLHRTDLQQKNISRHALNWSEHECRDLQACTRWVQLQTLSASPNRILSDAETM